jgi:hypothetical protein
MDRRTGTTPLLYSQPVLIVCATISLLAVRDAMSECAVKLTIEKWFRLVHLLEPFGFHCLTCADFCLIITPCRRNVEDRRRLLVAPTLRFLIELEDAQLIVVINKARRRRSLR